MTDNPTRRVMRGGSWLYDHIFVRATYRGLNGFRHDPHDRSHDLGLRVVRWPRHEEEERKGNER